MKPTESAIAYVHRCSSQQPSDIGIAREPATLRFYPRTRVLQSEVPNVSQEEERAGRLCPDCFR
ncbi:hypothetical protein DPEC_G00152160 [Dallia pectoralis]|uniref:Uncharacterized protein n=1 Tax=Dallia pectoralis TaxID=75939 RepID=A0ACC2GJE3_DALPE|nr:hypothetical protein DPEC_G00152160 [Dallia pectoralis]